MSYDYIRNRSGIDLTVNHLVRHIITDRIGTIMPAPPRAGEYVQVLFKGDKHVMPCLPQELEAVNDF